MTDEYRAIDCAPVGVVWGVTGGDRLVTSGDPIEPEIPDDTAPVIDNFDPPVGTEIGRTDYIQFDVTDDSGELASIVVLARYSNGSCEGIYDGSSFSPYFLAGSSRIAITDGFRFTIRRAGGWVTTPVTLQIIAIDNAGNVGEGEF